MGRFMNNNYRGRLNEPPETSTQPWLLHEMLPGYDVTPLVEAKTAARRIGVPRLLVKDESLRLGLPSFKILGASWAIFRELNRRFGIELEDMKDLESMKSKTSRELKVTLITATDGNHGRAVARSAALFGFDSLVFVPGSTVKARIEAIESEGAGVIVINGDYDAAVRAAAAEAGLDGWLIQDTGWPGYETVPGWIIEGYFTMFKEIEDQLAGRGEGDPALIAVQIGVGSLAASAARYYRRSPGGGTTVLIGVEPDCAACAFESVEAGKIVTVPGPHDSVMAGLNCGTVSSVAWPSLKSGIDVFTTIEDDVSFEAMRILAEDDIVSGESGAAALAGLLSISGTESGREFLDGALSRTSGSVLVISTEGITDPEMYSSVVG